MERAASHRPIDDLQRSRARRLRAAMTDAEKRLWGALRGHRFVGIQFRRQVPLGPYIADFCSHAARLLIEVDGGQHGEDAGRRRDMRRGSVLAGEGYRVLRFWNSEVLAETEAVLDVIWAALVESGVVSMGADTPLPVPPPQGGRGRPPHRRATTDARRAQTSTIDDGPRLRVPSPLVGEGQGGGYAAPADTAETPVSQTTSNAPVAMTGDTNAGPTP